MPYLLQRKRPYTLDNAPKIQPVVKPSGARPEVNGAVAPHPRLDVTDPVTLFDNLPITDTTSHRPLEMLDVRQGQKWGMEVDNRHDQALTIFAIGALSNDPATAPDISVEATVAANTRQAIISDTWMPYVGVRIEAAAAPTSGSVTVRGQVQIEA